MPRTLPQVNNAFVAYTGGIFSGKHRGPVNHAVLVVGYGTDSGTGMPYWVLRNSWGPSWGENGYMRIKRGFNQNGIVDFRPSYPTVVGAPPPPDPPGPTPPDPPMPAPDSNCPPVHTVTDDDVRDVYPVYPAEETLMGIASTHKVRPQQRRTACVYGRCGQGWGRGMLCKPAHPLQQNHLNQHQIVHFSS